ncbi:MAG: response regulator transcription factor [Marinoscillum sp.]
MINILLLEDELLLAEDLKQKLEHLNYNLSLIATSGEEVIAFVNKSIPDIAILDIEVAGEMDGLEVGSYLKKRFDMPIIYLTQFKDLQTFDKAKVIQPNFYLTKPVNIFDLVRAIELIIAQNAISKMPEQQGYLNPKALYLRSGEQSFDKVTIDEIFYLKASGAYTEVHTASKKYIFSENLSHFERNLNVPQLIRIHRSWIVNRDKVDRIEDSNLVINNERVTVGKTYKNAVKKHFKMI